MIVRSSCASQKHCLAELTRLAVTVKIQLKPKVSACRKLRPDAQAHICLCCTVIISVSARGSRSILVQPTTFQQYPPWPRAPQPAKPVLWYQGVAGLAPVPQLLAGRSCVAGGQVGFITVLLPASPEASL